MRWPFTTVARLDDLREQLKEVREEKRQALADLKRALDYIGRGSNGVPIFTDLPVAAATVTEEKIPEKDPMLEKVPTLAEEAIAHGAKSARDVQKYAQGKFDKAFENVQASLLQARIDGERMAEN